MFQELVKVLMQSEILCKSEIVANLGHMKHREICSCQLFGEHVSKALVRGEAASEENSSNTVNAGVEVNVSSDRLTHQLEPRERQILTTKSACFYQHNIEKYL